MNDHGGPDVLTVSELPDPVPGAHEVVIDVAAAGLNRADVLQRQGFYDPPPGAPAHLGLECSGRIAAMGDEVLGWQVGDEVCALLPGGGYAERVAVDAGSVLPVPAGVPLVDAAGLPEVTCTVWSSVMRTGRLSAGDRFLVHGGSSGIGTFAIQLARAHGAVPYCTARAIKHDNVLALGAERAFDYTATDFVAELRDATAGHGADVILDNIGAKYFDRNVTALARNGRLVIIGFQGGRMVEVDLAALQRKSASVAATGLRVRPLPEKADIIMAVRDQVWPYYVDGTIRPVIHARLPLADAADAHRLLESNAHTGKILLTTAG